MKDFRKQYPSVSRIQTSSGGQIPCLSTKTAWWLLVIAHTALGAAGAGETMLTTNKPELLSLVRSLEQVKGLGCIERDATGAIVSLALPEDYATDSNMVLVSAIHSLQQIRIYAVPLRATITERGIGLAKNLTNLTSLVLTCCGRCRADVWRAACDLRQLRRLVLNTSPAPEGDYHGLTNLVNLEELVVISARTFDDRALSYETNLMQLRKVQLNGTGVSGQWTNILKNCRSLTNAWVKVEDP